MRTVAIAVLFLLLLPIHAHASATVYLYGTPEIGVAGATIYCNEVELVRQGQTELPTTQVLGVTITR